MSLLHPTGHRPTTALPADCWMCDPTAGGALCPAHTAQVRNAATAQAQPGYGLPFTCRACGQTRMPLQRHDCPELRDEAQRIRNEDR